MTTDPYLRGHLQSRADEQTISVSSLQDITTAGDRSTRRTRLLGGFGAIALVMVGLFGVVGLQSSEKPTTMFAGLDAMFEGAPTTILATDDGWVGTVLIYDEDAWLLNEGGEIHLATSDDGESWELAERTGLLSDAQEIAIDEHDGRYWLAGAEGNEGYVAFSDDLKDWTRIEIPAVTESDDEMPDGLTRIVSANKLVANSAGVMTMFTSFVRPDFAYLEQKLGIESCGSVWTTSSTGTAVTVDLRPCGETEWQSTTVTGGGPTLPRPDPTLFFSSDGQTFEPVDLPTTNPVLRRVFGVQNLYSTGTGFGITGFDLHESSNGIDWTTVDVEQPSIPVLATAWGDQRLTAASLAPGPAASLTPGTVEVRLSADGDEWTTHNLNEVLGLESEDTNQSFIFTALEAGEAGWAISGSIVDDNLSDRMIDGEGTEVVVPMGDLELRATAPAGSAELVAEDGEVIASWHNFELGALDRNEYLQFQDDQFTLVDGRGELVAEGSLQPILSELQHSSGQPANVVLFSPDGETWTELERAVGYVAGLAVGDDEIVVARYSADGLTSTRLPVEAD